jgi:DNA transformation protein and related proteins
MAADRAFVDYLLELLEPLPGITAKRMFGGYGLFRDGLMFGLVADSTLYFKVDETNRALFLERELTPFTYEAKGKPMTMSYYEAPGEVLDNSDDMVEWAEIAYGAALRAKK